MRMSGSRRRRLNDGDNKVGRRGDRRKGAGQNTYALLSEDPSGNRGRKNKAVFLNFGVKLACEGSEFLDELAELESKGFELYVCGTCLDYFNLKSSVRHGKISNMLEIMTIIKESEKTVCLT